MFTVNFSLSGDMQIASTMAELERKLKNLRPIFSDIADDFRSTMNSVFANSGAFDGRSAWAPLSEEYKGWKSAHVGSKPILEYTGAMRKSLTSISGSHICHISAESLIIGSSDPKVPYHQAGTSKMPKRTVVEITSNQKDRWAKIVTEYLFK